MSRFVFLALLLATGSRSHAQTPTPIEYAQVESFSEGPVFDSEGNLYVSHGAFISKITPDSTQSIWAETGSPNGHKILYDGTHLVCDTTIVHLDADGTVIGVIARTCGTRPTRATNDLTIAPDGGFYFTDPGVISQGALEKPIGCVCYVGPDGETRLVADSLLFPNGIVLSQGGESLIVTEFGKNRVLEYSILAPGEVAEMRVLAELPNDGAVDFLGPDGVALDTDGNMYIAHFGTAMIRVLSPNGTLLNSLPSGIQYVSNLVFGGAQMRDLYFTGSGNTWEPGVVYRLRLENVAGAEIPD